METPSFFKLKVKPGEEDEYVRRHQNVWPQVTRDLEMAGVEVNLCTIVIFFFLNDVHKIIAGQTWEQRHDPRAVGVTRAALLTRLYTCHHYPARLSFPVGNDNMD